ncbi:MAG: sulfite exporter TauE/SafE family protein [Bacteroidales bacterium]|nr:sulfite exporter TauE/SafE family protein [Bacteroidales bacterium]
MEASIYLLVLCIGASFVQRVTGFGFGIFIMTWLTALMPSYGEATALSGILALCTSLLVTIRMWRHIQWNHLWLILIAFMAVAGVCIFALAQIHDAVLNVVLGCVLIFASIYFLFINGHIHLRPTRATQVVAGSLSGAMGGFFAMQGPPAVLYFLASEHDKNQYMATVQTYFLVGNIGMALVRAANGFVTEAVGWGFLYGIGGVIVGNVIGALVFKRISIELLRTIVYIYLAISGVMILLR